MEYPCPKRLYFARAFGCSTGTRRLFLGLRHYSLFVSLTTLRVCMYILLGGGDVMVGGEEGTYLIVGRSTRFWAFSRKPAGVVCLVDIV